jgi:hypothetical protein
MGYYVRVLSPLDDVPPLNVLAEALEEIAPSVKLAIEGGDAEEWEQLLLAQSDDTLMALIERNPVRPGELGAIEVAEFLDEIADAKPASAVRWLREYLPGVRCIYSFQVLNGTKTMEDWAALHAVRTAVQESVGGIMQADGEGFSNEEGCHILWQFRDDVKGPWWMAVLKDGEWITFEMELGNREHRAAFLRGEIPAGITAARPGE